MTTPYRSPGSRSVAFTPEQLTLFRRAFRVDYAAADRVTLRQSRPRFESASMARLGWVFMAGPLFALPLLAFGSLIMRRDTGQTNLDVIVVSLAAIALAWVSAAYLSARRTLTLFPGSRLANVRSGPFGVTLALSDPPVDPPIGARRRYVLRVGRISPPPSVGVLECRLQRRLLASRARVEQCLSLIQDLFTHAPDAAPLDREAAPTDVPAYIGQDAEVIKLLLAVREADIDAERIVIPAPLPSGKMSVAAFLVLMLLAIMCTESALAIMIALGSAGRTVRMVLFPVLLFATTLAPILWVRRRRLRRQIVIHRGAGRVGALVGGTETVYDFSTSGIGVGHLDPEECEPAIASYAPGCSGTYEDRCPHAKETVEFLRRFSSGREEKTPAPAVAPEPDYWLKP